MKKVAYILSLICLLLNYSCSDDEKGPGVDAESKTITFQFTGAIEENLSGIATPAEKSLSSVSIFMFSEQNGEMRLEGTFYNVHLADAPKGKTASISTSGRNSKKKFYVIGNNSFALSESSALITENEFKELSASVVAEPITTPLLMTGYTSLIEVSDGQTVNVNLQRRVARFDINNNKDITGFEIERVVIYETREAPFLFENAEGRDTIKRTTVEINHFSAMDGANKGLSASAFYLYPALNNEEVRIVLEGKRSDEAEVRAYSLKINNSRELNIQAGQRYLLNIVSAGSGEVTGELTVRNWEDKAIGIKESSAEDYSGITWITKDQYAVVTDKKDGFYLFTIDMDNDGNVTRFTRGAFMGDPSTSRDCEGIIWHPDRGTFFISGEADQEILEYNSNGSKTGEKLAVPSMFKGGTGNYGFEALAYNQTTGLFWTTTESTLSRDGAQASYNNSIHNLLRIQSFDESLQAQEQYAYKMDLPQATATARTYAFGVPEITALPNGDLLILEREFYVTEFGLGSWVQVKLYLVEPGKYSDVSAVEDLRTLADISFMEKQLLWEKRTTFPADLANYEGMCLGPLLNNGERPLLLINDSQAGYQGLLKEYLLVLKLTEEQNSDIIAWE